MRIRKTHSGDLPVLLEMFDLGRKKQYAIGNIFQWPVGYPSEELLLKDIESGHSYVVVSEGTDDTDDPAGTILGTFYLKQGENSVFNLTNPDTWLNSDQYQTVQRVCTSCRLKGTGSFIFSWLTSTQTNLRLYTHETNIPMMRLAEKFNFINVGEIEIGDGVPRVAYHFVKE